MHWLEIATLAVLPVFLALDFVLRARRYETPSYWRLRTFAVSAVIFWFAMQLGLAWGALTDGFSLIDGRGLGIAGGAVVGILVYQFFHYWYHRLAHRFDWLFRAGHQMHHSAESIDAFSAYYLHPFDAFMFTTISSLVFFPLLGLVPEAGAIGALFLTFCGVFQHANISTPHWLGYVIQRPESHCIHHGRGVHAWNYADVPLWDIVFGTFNNPRDVEGMKAGYYNGASTRIGAMLFARDVSEPAANDVAGALLEREAANARSGSRS
jgi:sterol desaturase/sphingolipid hydroxylase (fatty acid hydroxylase superfamily)